MGSACSVSSIDILGPAIALHVEEHPLSHTVFSFYLSPSQLAALFSNFSMATFLPGDVVYKAMDVSDGFLLVADDGGKIALEEELAGSPVASSRANKDQLLTRPLVGAGDFFGEGGVLGPLEASRGHKAVNAGPGPVTLWHCSRSAYSIFLRVYVHVCVCVCVCVFAFPSACLSVCLFVCLFVCLSVCLSAMCWRVHTKYLAHTRFQS